MAFGVADDDDGLEAGALTGTGLFLDGFDLFADDISMFFLKTSRVHVVSEIFFQNTMIETICLRSEKSCTIPS